ncbi:MAG: hypothetical protein QOH83_501 [Solirubrobacteraceae bacterium]|jgi:hypothetical protein|nr:hypothetical protein [Solirubrobacteraceae bacterium]
MLLRAWFARPEAQAPDWYRSSFALSTASKRMRGVSPQQHRAAAAAGARVGQAG